MLENIDQKLDNLTCFIFGLEDLEMYKERVRNGELEK